MRTLSGMPYRAVVGIALLMAAGLYAAAFSAETPVGRLRGSVRAGDTGKPLEGIRVVVNPGVPKNGQDARSETTERDGSFVFDRLPAGSYEVKTFANVYSTPAKKVTFREGQTQDVPIVMTPRDPFLNLFIHQHAYLPEDNPRIALNGFRQGEGVQLKLYQVDGSALVRNYGGDVRALLTPVAQKGGPKTLRVLQSGARKPMREWLHTVRKRDAEGVFYEYERLGTLKPGIYLLEATGVTTADVGWFMVTDLALVTKASGKQILAYTVDLRSGKPVPGVRISLYDRSADAGHGVSDAHGVAELRTSETGTQLDAVALRGDSVAFQRIWTYDSEAAAAYRVVTYTDRPVYRPGDTVQFKGIVRHPQGVGYAVPSARTVSVQVKDWQENSVYHDDLNLNGQGSFFGELTLPQEALGGNYSLTVTIDGHDYPDNFAVASYRKPEWQVNVAFAKHHYIRGEPASAAVSAHYYYGAAVAGAKVHYTVYRSPYWAWEDDEDMSFVGGDEGGGEGDFGEVVTEGDLTTDADGTAGLSFPTRTEEKDAASQPYRYRVEAEVSDESNRMASGNGSVVVSPGEITLLAHPDHYVAQPGESVDFVVRAHDLDGKAVAGLSLTADAAMEMWTGSKLEQQPLAKGTVTTDATGSARFTLKPTKPGLVRVTFSSKDARGNAIDANTDLWVSTAEGGDLPSRYPRLSVLLDRKNYRIGDSAQLLINTDRPGATALVAVEAEHVLQHQVVALKSRSTLVRIPVRAGYEPNVFVDVCFVKDGGFSNTHTRLNVSPAEHRLKVTVQPDRTTYHPGDNAQFQIRTTDEAGHPVRSEVSFGLVDEAIYAIQPDRKNLLWETFYPRRTDQVNTSFSYPNVYLGDAAKDGTSVAVRKDFKDTAYWSPVLHTDGDGRASVRVRLPDNLTSWRATVQAHSPATQVGEGKVNVQVMRELTLRLQTPRMLTEGDRFEITAVAHNYSTGPLDVQVQLNAQGLEVTGDTNRRVRLDPGQAQALAWETLARTPGTATVTATASGGAYKDGMQLTVPIRPFARESVKYETGAVSDDTATETLTRDAAAVSGNLEVRLAPTMAGAVLGSLDYLATYPYGCTEQTMSGFLPDVFVLRTLRGLGLHRPQLEQRVPEMARSGLMRLYGFQQDEGGWGWWEHGKVDPWMTSYVLFGLLQAREAGIDVNPRVLENGLNAAQTLVGNKDLSLDDAAFLAYVLSLANRSEKAKPLFKRLEQDYGKLQARSLGYRVLALTATGSAADREKAESAMQLLWSQAIETGGLLHWAEKKTKYPWEVPQTVESTAVILKAALALNPQEPRLAGVVRWLLMQRHGNKWESTRDTAWILFALSDYLRSTGELNPDYRLTVLLNGKQIHQQQVGQSDALQEEAVIRIPLKDLQESNKVELRKEGRGVAYYALQLTQQIKTATFAAESAVPGVTLTREYFLMEARKDAEGHYSTLPAKNPTLSAKIGDRLLVRLKIHTDQPLQYLLLDDPLPVGFEVQDRGILAREDWDYWWEHMDVRDDRVNVFMQRLPPGDHEVEYYVRPEVVGTSHALPAVLSDMYVPSVRISTGDAKLEVRK